MLIDSGANVNACDINGYTPFHSVLEGYKNRDSRKVYCQSHSCYSSGVHVPETVQIYYCRYNQNYPKVIQKLVMNGANITALDNQLRTPLRLALEVDDPKVVSMLLKIECTLDLEFDHDLLVGCIDSLGHTPSVVSLIEAGVNLNIANDDGNTLLH